MPLFSSLFYAQDKKGQPTNRNVLTTLEIIIYSQKIEFNYGILTSFDPDDLLFR